VRTCLARCSLICALLLLLLQRAASHGFFINLDAVLLKLCGPFLDPGSGVFWKRVDPSYVTLGSRLNFKEVCCMRPAVSYECCAALLIFLVAGEGGNFKEMCCKACLSFDEMPCFTSGPSH
jgi:hypothetical protein